jgi:hypothetical protein
MAVKYIRAILLPNLNSVSVTAIAATRQYEDGVGLQNERRVVIGWIDIHTQEAELRKKHFEKVLLILSDLINNPRRATQPDFSFLNEGV